MAVDSVSRISAILSAVADLRGFSEFENRLGQSARTIESQVARINSSLANLGVGGIGLERTLGNLERVAGTLERIIVAQRQISSGGTIQAIAAGPAGGGGRDYDSRRQDVLVERLIDRIERRGQTPAGVAVTPAGQITDIIGETPGSATRRLNLQRELDASTRQLAQSQRELARAMSDAERYVNSKGFLTYANSVQSGVLQSHAATAAALNAGDAEDFFRNFVPNANERRTGTLSAATIKKIAARNALGGAGHFEEIAGILLGTHGGEPASSYLGGRRNIAGRYTSNNIDRSELQFAPSRNDIAIDTARGATENLAGKVYALEQRVIALRQAVGATQPLVPQGRQPLAITAGRQPIAALPQAYPGTRYLQGIAELERSARAYQQASREIGPARFTSGPTGTYAGGNLPAIRPRGDVVPYVATTDARGVVVWQDPRTLAGAGGGAGGIGGGAGGGYGQFGPGGRYGPAAAAAGGGYGSFGPPPPGGGGGFFDDFGRGFRGRGERPYAEQIGQAVKFSVFYGAAYNALFRITQALTESVQQALNFESALVQLNIATGKTREANADLADALGSAAASFGLTPAEGVQIGARSVGLFGLQNAPEAQQRAAALAQVQTAGQLSLLTGQKPEDIQRTLAAISQSFGTGYQGGTRIADLDTFLTKRFGGLAGSSLETLSQVGTLGTSAGFSPEMIAAIAAKVQSQTGQTPSAVAGLLSQFFTRAGEGNLQELFAKYGISQEGDLFSQVQKLSGVYQTLGAPERQQVNAAFGRGRSQGAAGIILSNFGQISAAAGDAGTLGQGAAQRAATEVLNSIPGQIKVLLGAFKELAKDLGESGLLSVLGLLALATKQVVQGLDGFVKLLNEIPAPIREAAYALVALAAAARFVNGSAGITGRLGRGAFGRTPLVGPVASDLATRTAIQGSFLPSAYGGNFQALRAASLARGAGAVGASIGAAGSLGLAALGGPIGLTVIGLTGLAVAAGNAKKTLDNISEADVQSKDALANANLVSTLDDVKNAAAYTAQAAEAQRTARSGFFAGLSGTPDTTVRLDTTSAYLANRATAIQEEQNRAAAEQKVSVFGTGTGADIQAGFEALTAAGVSADEQMRLLAQSISGVATAVEGFQPELFSTKVVAALFGIDSVQRTVSAFPGAGPQPGKIDPYGGSGLTPAQLGTQQVNVFDTLDPNARQQATQDLIGALQANQPGKGGFTQEQAQKIADATLANLHLTPEELAALQPQLIDLIINTLKSSTSAFRQFTPQEALDRVNATRAGADAAIANLPRGSAPSAKITELRRAVRVNQNTLNNTSGEPTSELLNKITDSKQALAEAELEESTKIRLALQRKAKTAAEIKRIGNAFLKSDIQKAVAAGDATALVDIVTRSGAAGLAIAQAAVAQALAAARAALRMRRIVIARVKAMNAQINRIEGTQGVDYSGSGTAAEEAAVKAQRDLEKALNQGIDLGPSDKPSDYTDPFAGDSGGGGGGTQATAAQIRAARAQANAQRRGGDVGLARAALQGAAADLAATKKGTVEFYQALGSYYDAQIALRDALLQYQLNRRLLKIDITDSVAEARENLALAKQKLTSDRRRGRSAEVINADELDVRRQQANYESEKFNRWLSDLQTNQRLRRITNAQYLRSIENEIEHLQKVKKRTRQQQEELNQLQEILQAAKEALSGQFNLGDIKVPTPYEARRFVAAQVSPGGVGPTGGATTINTITISGADTGAVLALLRQVLGPSAVQTATTAPRRG